jgi:hypothetical protein
LTGWRGHLLPTAGDWKRFRPQRLIRIISIAEELDREQINSIGESARDGERANIVRMGLRKSVYRLAMFGIIVRRDIGARCVPQIAFGKVAHHRE